MLTLIRTLSVFAAASSALWAQASLSVKWEELVASDFVKAIQKAQGTCVLPFGVIEKHGPQLPLGTDLINARWRAVHAAEQEYAVVFPAYYFGQIFEAKHQPGTIAYSARLQLDLLQETTDEMARNGCKKILIVNGHGGNRHLLPFFAQMQLASPRDYVVYIAPSAPRAPGRPPMKSSFEQHAGESETSAVMISAPELVRLDLASSQSGADLKRLDLPANTYTGIWWYSSFPEHYAGDGSPANKALGEFDMKNAAAHLAQVIRGVKADQVAPKMQKEFFEKAEHPLDTKQ